MVRRGTSARARPRRAARGGLPSGATRGSGTRYDRHRRAVGLVVPEIADVQVRAARLGSRPDGDVLPVALLDPVEGVLPQVLTVDHRSPAGGPRRHGRSPPRTSSWLRLATRPDTGGRPSFSSSTDSDVAVNRAHVSVVAVAGEPSVDERRHEDDQRRALHAPHAGVTGSSGPAVGSAGAARRTSTMTPTTTTAASARTRTTTTVGRPPPSSATSPTVGTSSVVGAVAAEVADVAAVVLVVPTVVLEVVLDVVLGVVVWWWSRRSSWSSWRTRRVPRGPGTAVPRRRDRPGRSRSPRGSPTP